MLLYAISVGNLRIWSHLLKKSLMENFIFCAVVAKHKLITVPITIPIGCSSQIFAYELL